MDLMEATEAVLVLINTRPVGRRPDGLNRWSDLGPLVAEYAPPRRMGNAPPADDATAEIADARRLREALTAVVLADSPTRAGQCLEELAAAHGTVIRFPGHHQQSHLVTDKGSPVAELVVVLIPLLHQAVAAGVLDRIGVVPRCGLPDRVPGPLPGAASGLLLTEVRHPRPHEPAPPTTSSGGAEPAHPRARTGVLEQLTRTAGRFSPSSHTTLGSETSDAAATRPSTRALGDLSRAAGALLAWEHGK